MNWLARHLRHHHGTFLHIGIGSVFISPEINSRHFSFAQTGSTMGATKRLFKNPTKCLRSSLTYSVRRSVQAELVFFSTQEPNGLLSQVLKALALVRLGRVEEAQVILKEVQKEEPYEDATLQAMAICFRETHQRKFCSSCPCVHTNSYFDFSAELTCQAYESAIKKDPQNEEFLSHLFMSYVRVGDYRKQQLTAMALYKVKSKNPYYFWAVMSILMQVCVKKNVLFYCSH